MAEIVAFGELLVDFVPTGGLSLAPAPAFKRAPANVAVGGSKLGTRLAFMGNDELGNMLVNIVRRSHGVSVMGLCVCQSPGGWEKGIHVLQKPEREKHVDGAIRASFNKPKFFSTPAPSLSLTSQRDQHTLEAMKFTKQRKPRCSSPSTTILHLPLSPSHEAAFGRKRTSSRFRMSTCTLLLHQGEKTTTRMTLSSAVIGEIFGHNRRFRS